MKKQNQRPNILWIFCEDVCPWFSCYGDDTVETPNIDSLAKAGTLFENCFSSAPVCSPARSGIITGCMPTTLGIHNHVSSRLEEPPIFLPDYVKTVPEIFKEAGYYTFNNGKDDYNFVYNREDLYSGSYITIQYWGKHGRGDWSDRNSDQPFFGQIQLVGGKNHKEPEEEVNPEKVEIAPYYPDTQEFKKKYIQHYNQIKVTDREVGQIIQRLKDEGLYENTIIFLFSDHGYGLLRHKQFCYDGGIHVPLIISAPGYPDQVKPDEVRQDLVSSIDIAATSLSLAGIKVPLWMESRNIFSYDFNRDYVISARDRCDFTIDRIRSVRTQRYKYIRNFLTDRPLMQPQYRDHSVCYKQWFQLYKEGKLNQIQAQFVSDERPAEELYDLENDPHETNNLAKEANYKEQLEKMRSILENWIQETDDQGQYPESGAELYANLKRWGKDRCVNPEYDRVRNWEQDQFSKGGSSPNWGKNT